MLNATYFLDCTNKPIAESGSRSALETPKVAYNSLSALCEIADVNWSEQRTVATSQIDGVLAGPRELAALPTPCHRPHPLPTSPQHTQSGLGCIVSICCSSSARSLGVCRRRRDGHRDRHSGKRLLSVIHLTFLYKGWRNGRR